MMQRSVETPATGAAVPQAPALILIIDDIPANLGVMVDLLETEGHRVLVAKNGAEGLARAESEQPDLILLDVMMPGENGFAVCRRLKAGAATRQIPVIFMTSLDDLQDKLEGFAAGGVDYVAKPLQIAEVVTRVRTHLELSTLRRKLATQNKELRQARDELEERVQLRTAALTAEIEERRRAELELQKSSEQIHDLYDHAPCGYHSLDKDGICVRVNDTQLNWLGYSRSELLGRRLIEFLTPQSARLFDKAFPLIKQRGWVRDIELRLVRRDGSTLPVLLSATAVRDSAGQFVMTRTTLYDLSERKQSEELIRHMAHHDPLTGLSNRTLFQQRLGQLITHARRRQESVATMFLDLDQFNQINDSFGHAVGDMVLREISSRLSACLRESDALARWGGDEFVVALATPDVHQTSRQVAEMMLAALSEPVFAEKHELHLSGSIGISLYPTDGLDVQTLLRAADTAMYHAKEKGRGTVEFFTPALTAKVQHRTTLAAQLHGARARDELYLDFQPQIDIDSGRILGAEALLRWQHPDLGAVAPTEFIPIAEDTGLIQALGEWALRQACAQGKRWHDAGYDELTLAVNVSVRQLADLRICERVALVLEETGFPAKALELEITENLLMQPTYEVLRTLNGFNRLGIRLTVDDFGVGYSSLSYLQRFPIQALKIDRTFVNRIGLAANDDAIVEAIIALAHSLHLRVLAEGVETPAQIEFLRVRGCRAAQGYFYSWPVSPARFTELLDQQTSLPALAAVL
jgi:diguanylate cyclase (GGDEF)-like protein/PAS domain S-box-containing protein